VEPLVVEASPGLYLDMHLNTARPVSKERVLERRAQILEIYRAGFEADAVVVTPGLIESWLDSMTGLFVSRMPNRRLARQLGSERYRFQLLTYAQCYECLTVSMDLLDPARRKPILVTVSPVPIQRTFTDQDI